MALVAGQPAECDVLVIGSGAGGLSLAITAKRHGLDVIVVEKAPVFGGTTAFSGGVLWIPGNPHCRPANADDAVDKAKTYLKSEAGNFYNEEAVDAFLHYGPKMLEFFERETEVKFVASLYPDYHPDAPGGVDVGRSITAAPYDARRLGKDLHRLRPPLATITFIGMMFNSSNADLKHFFNATRSLTSAAYVMRRLASHIKDLALYRRGVQVTSGNALAARLAKSAIDLDIPIITSAPAHSLTGQDGAIDGAIVEVGGKPTSVRARKAVVLASGGFPHDQRKIAAAYPHVARGGEHFSPTPRENTGDGIDMAEGVGGVCALDYPNASAWMPVSKVPRPDGSAGAFPHLVDRYKPGVIAVLKSGRRFTNESNSYHDVGAAMIDACSDAKETAAWLICDHATMRKYGLGFAKPAPVPTSLYVKSGYLQRGDTLQDLARQTDIDPAALEETVEVYNRGAVNGLDPAFGRGTTSFNRYLGDPAHVPNPTVGPILKPPFYALKIMPGDLGTFDGLKTDVFGRVLTDTDQPIRGLYAVGNDRASIMGGAYPGAGITLGPNMTFGYLTGLHIAGAVK